MCVQGDLIRQPIVEAIWNELGILIAPKQEIKRPNGAIKWMALYLTALLVDCRETHTHCLLIRQTYVFTRPGWLANY